MSRQPNIPVGTEAPRLRLRVLPGGLTIELVGQSLLVGRLSDADLRLPFPDVSRRHGLLVFSPTGWEIHDLGSLNGIYVNDVRSERAALRTGDRIRICGIEFQVDAGQSADPAVSVNTFVEALAAATRRSA